MLPLSTESVRAGFLYVTCSAESLLCSHKSSCLGLIVGVLAERETAIAPPATARIALEGSRTNPYGLDFGPRPA